MFRPVSRCVRGSGMGWRVYPLRGYFTHTGRIPGRHKNGEYAAATRGHPAFQWHKTNTEGSDTTPTQKCRKNAKREFNHLPQQGSRRNPAKRFRWEEDERQRARVLPLAAGRGIRRPLGRRPASHLSGLRRSRCPAKCTGRGAAPHPIFGRKPCTHFAPPALRGDERNHFREVIDYEKRYQIQHAHGGH